MVGYVFYFLQTSATAPLGAVPARALTAATMEGRLQQVVSAIEEMSSRGELSKLLAHLQAQEEVLIQAMPQLDDLLPVLNPAMHTLGMVFILHCKAAAVPLSNLQAVNTFLSQCRTVLLGGDPEQIRTIPKEFVAVRHLPPRRRARLSHLSHGRFGPLPPPPLRRTPAGVHPWPAPPGRCPRPDRAPHASPHASALDDPRLTPQVCNKFSAAAIAIKSPLVAVRPLMAAAAALQPGPTHFTPLHAECLKAPPLYACACTMHACS